MQRREMCLSSQYLIGIDGGGTNSRLLAVDMQGNEICFCHGKSTSLESNPSSVVRANLVSLLDKAQLTCGLSLKDCAGMCFGTAGVDTEHTRLSTENILDDLDMRFPIRVVNDSEIALYGNTRGGPGLMLISGTGSIGYGINRDKKIWRAGGFGYLVGDQGSAYWVGARGVEAALRAYDHTGPDTCLINDFCKYLNLSQFDEILDFIYQHNKSDLARLAPVVDMGREKRDAVAAGIMNDALGELTLLITTLVRELEMSDREYPLLLGGGFLINTKWLYKALKARVTALYPKLSISGMKVKAEWGAVYMAADMIGIKLPGMYDTSAAVHALS